MSRSSIFAAAVLLLGLAAFLLLVSGGPRVSWLSPEPTPVETLVVVEAPREIIIEPGIWIAYEEPTYVSHEAP